MASYSYTIRLASVRACVVVVCDYYRWVRARAKLLLS